MLLERKTATETDEAKQSIHCEEHSHEDWSKEWVQESRIEDTGPVDKYVYQHVQMGSLCELVPILYDHK